MEGQDSLSTSEENFENPIVSSMIEQTDGPMLSASVRIFLVSVDKNSSRSLFARGAHTFQC